MMNVNNVNSPNLMSALERRPGELRKEKRAVAEESVPFGAELLQAAAIPLRTEPQSLSNLPSLPLETSAGAADPNVRNGSDIEKSNAGSSYVNSRGEMETGYFPMSSGESMAAKPALQAKTVNSQTYAGNVNRSSGTLKAAASLNTAAATAGLKPWSKEWVFENRLESPAVQPLLSSGAENAQPLLAELEQMIASARKASGMEVPGAVEKQQPVIASQAGTAQAAALSQLVRGGAENATEISEFMSTGRGNQASGAAAVLSGAEFLTTLNAVREESGKGAQHGGSQGEQREAPMQSPKLRVIEGSGLEKVKRPEFRESMTAQAGMEVDPRVALLTPQLSRRTVTMPRPLEVTGHVTQGAMTANRLSSETLLGLSTGIRELRAQGGGEIRIRLKPENLGELHLRVVTSGNSVGLQIQASDERAKKVIEETMSHLKDSLASQNLSLNKVDLSVAASSQAFGSDLDGRQEQQSQGQRGFEQSNLLGQNMNQQGQLGNQSRGSERWENIDSDMTSVSRVGRSRGASRNAAGLAGQVGANSGNVKTAGSTRLDVMA